MRYFLTSHRKSQSNRLNIVPIVEVREDDGVTPVIEPTTGLPLVLSDDLMGFDANVANTQAVLGTLDDAIARRRQIEKGVASVEADLDAKIAAGGEITPTKPDASEQLRRLRAERVGRLVQALTTLSTFLPNNNADIINLKAKLAAIYADHPSLVVPGIADLLSTANP